MPVIVRNLLLGCTTFTELVAGTPGIPRSLLSKRLGELQRAGVITVRPKPDGHGSFYELTPAGRELWPVVLAMRTWGGKWLEVTPAHAGPDVVLWSWSTTCLRRERLPKSRVLARFDLLDQPERNRRLWLLVDDGAAEVCGIHPGFDEDLIVTVRDSTIFARWHLGLLEWGDALRSGDIRVDGPRALARALPEWNKRDRVATSRLDGRGPASARRPLPEGATPPPVAHIRGFTGRLLAPGDDGYDQARSLRNGAIDVRPGFIAQCRTPGDVAAALTFARDRDLPLTVRGGGHGVAGTALCENGVVIDLSLMKGVRGAAYSINVNAAWLPHEPVADRETAWARRFFAALAPHQAGAYINFLDHDDPASLAYDTETRDRLASLKRRYDPDNIFRPLASQQV